MRFGKSWPAAPVIVAEALIGVPDALLTALRPGPPASGAAVASSLARSLAPPEHPVTGATWLLPAQARSFRRVLAAIHRYGGALLADPVGSGKTYVALAVAAAVNRGSTACLVPAALIAQWQATANQFSIPITLCSHEQVSRGRLPAGTRGVVIIDESHHFRNPGTRRYHHLAPWLIGRAALLLTATPVVNRLTDLLHQLLLTIRDDALASSGVPSLFRVLADERPHPALGQLIFEQDAKSIERPSRVYTSSRALARENVAASRNIDRLSQLRLSRSEPIAALVRGVLLRAMASSPAAYSSALRRYRSLLLHARDANLTGHAFDRAALRRFVGPMENQLVFWELFSSTDVHTDLELADLDSISSLLAEAREPPPGGDGKLHRLRRLLNDGAPTLIFTTSRDTVDYLRRQLSDLGIAWCTGERAGIGGASMARRVVLNWFRQPAAASHAPRHLVVTDVAAEGLDLPRASRVIHYDLPWTPMRLEQREGRSVRYGSSHATIEVVQFRLPSALERRLALEATLVRKEGLPAVAGLGSRGRRLWRWRSELAESFESVESQEGVASVTSEGAGLLAGFTLFQLGHSSATVLWLESNGNWTEDSEIIESRLQAAARHGTIGEVPAEELSRCLLHLAEPIRSRLALARSRRWMGAEPTSSARRLVSRLQLCIQSAARRRDARELAELERAIAFAAGGHTAGESVLLERLAHASHTELRRLLSRVPDRRPNGNHPEIRLTGLVLFQPAHSGAARIVSPAWRDYKLHSSTSMEL